MQRVQLAALSAATGALVTFLVVSAWRPEGVAAQGQSSANMQVSANVIRKCVLLTNPLNFGSYDPVQANAAAPLDGQTTIRVSCTKGTAVNIAMDDGANAEGATRRMSGGGTNLLGYELFKDASRTQRWGSDASERFDAGVAPSRDPRDFIVYGRVAGAQDVNEGAFQDTIVVTVQF
jgi:spore coat protein U-like protein